jgi:disulfide oxidoreductase YuzD
MQGIIRNINIQFFKNKYRKVLWINTIYIYSETKKCKACQSIHNLKDILNLKRTNLKKKYKMNNNNKFFQI